MTNAAESARARLAATGRAKDRSRRLATIFIVTGLILAAWLLVALLDYWLMLPMGPRWAALIGLCLLAVGGVWQMRRLWRQPTALKEAALDVEAARPELGCEISTAAEYLTGERSMHREYEPELVAALQTRAADAVASGGPSYASRVRRPALIAVCALGFVAAFLIAVPGAWTALWRTVTPWSRAHFTQVEVTPGSVDIPVGQTLVISNRFSGRAISTASIEVKEEGSDVWQPRVLTGDTNGVFRHEAGAVRRSFAYRVRGGDAISDEFTITAYIPPAVQQLTLGTTPPAYTGLPAGRQTTADATVLRGTRARFEIQPNVPLSKARLHFTNDAVVELTQGPQGRWEGEIPVSKDMDFAIELLDAKGRRGTPTRHHITALPDEAPTLDIVEPGQDMRADATNTIPLRIRGADDFGITRVRLKFHRLGSPEQELLLQPVLGTNHSFEAMASLALDPLKLSLYDVVAYHVEAEDNNTLDGPGVGRSPVYFIEITNEGGGPKPKPKSKPKPGEKVNLLTVQKQIISDTASLAPRAGAPPFEELALRQNDAVAFGRLYQESLMAAGAPVAAQAALEDALKSMQSAASDLGAKNRGDALRQEEQALASLYQVLKNTPALAKLMDAPPKKEEETDKPKPPKVNVAVQALEKKSKPDPNAQELQAMLESMKALAERQSQLTKQLTDPARGESQPDATTPPSDSPAAAAAAAPGEAAKSPGAAASPPAGSPQPSTPGQPKPAEAKETAAADAGKDAGKDAADATQEGAPEAETAAADSASEKESPTDAVMTPPGQGKSPSKSTAAAKGKGKGKSKAKGKGQGQVQGEGEGQAMAKAEPSNQPRDAKARPKNSEKASKGNGKGKGPSPASQQASAKNPPGADAGKPGEKSPSEKSTDPASQPPASESEPLAQEPPPALEAMAPQQEQLSQEAREMAERLQRLAGKGMRTGQGISRQVSQAAQQMDRAAHALRQGNAQSAAGAGDQGSAAMNGAISLLERVIAGRPEVNDVASEEAPKQYEGVISEYFRRLSRAE